MGLHEHDEQKWYKMNHEQEHGVLFEIRLTFFFIYTFFFTLLIKIVFLTCKYLREDSSHNNFIIPVIKLKKQQKRQQT